MGDDAGGSCVGFSVGGPCITIAQHGLSRVWREEGC
jgi:hypothetical protein